LPKFSAVSVYRIEYLMLVDAKPAGPILGYYRDRPIPAAVVDYLGRRYLYAGLALRNRSGRYDIDALAPGERLIEPGLVYRAEESRRKVA
jgi:hypothetical protein